jgi:dTDP-4-dehydrorhamnose reductase
MKTLILGSAGQLGYELQRSCPDDVECIALERTQLDVADRSAVLAAVEKERPQLLINAAAYTAVDGAETKPDLALAVNGEGPEHLAYAADQVGARLLQVSTDFVFDGAGDTPYGPQAEPRPLGVYGHSKLAGERRVQEILPLQSVVLRTAWVYSAHGGNFVKTMLKLMNERTQISVVNDQVGAPTWARGLAQALWQFRLDEASHGVFHWTDDGACSWYDFACAIYEEAVALGLAPAGVEIHPITTEEYPTPAQRPAYSVLDSSSTRERLGLPATAWREQLRSMLQEIAA